MHRLLWNENSLIHCSFWSVLVSNEPCIFESIVLVTHLFAVQVIFTIFFIYLNCTIAYRQNRAEEVYLPS